MGECKTCSSCHRCTAWRRVDDSDLRWYFALGRELDVDPRSVWQQAGYLFRSSSIRLEADLRLRETGQDLSDKHKIRTLRGHIRRQLADELRKSFEGPGIA